MNNKLIIIVFLFFILIGCENRRYFVIDETAIVKHEECMEKLVLFPLSEQSSDIQVSGKLDSKDFSIQDGRDDYDFKLQYASSFTTGGNNTSEGISNVSKYLRLLFINRRLNLDQGLFIPVDNKNINATVQEIFSKAVVPISSNLDSLNVELVIENTCDNSRSLLSSLYSSKLNQSLVVDEFEYRSANDSVHYYLKVHGYDLELASSIYNDFNTEIVKEWRGEYNPVYDFELDTFNVKFSIADD